MMPTIKGLPVEELVDEVVGLGHSAYRGRQLFRWLYQARESRFEAMTDLNKAFRAELASKYALPKLKVRSRTASEDGTIKYLIELPDGNAVESVYIPNGARRTLCLSTQVGCKMGCTFCATGYMGWKRDLQSWEIVDQLISIDFPEPITNLVLMGMGEPFDNYESMLRALKIFQDPLGPKIGKKHITVSTVGLTPKFKPFVEAELGQIAVSLHGTTEAQRAEIMPVSRKYPLKELMKTCRELKFKSRRRVTFEYILFKDFNDSDADARRLVELVKGLPCKFNLLAYNEVEYCDLKRPSEERVERFQRILTRANLTATYRRSRGRDITGACGQLHSKTSAGRSG